MSDDPFADPPEEDRTMMRPRPGGGRAAPPSGGPAPGSRTAPIGATRLPASLASIGVNPLTAAAAPLLAAAIRLRGRVQHPNPDELHLNLVQAVREFEKRALSTGLDTRSLRGARYALCATLDDLVLSTPWGSQSIWNTQSLVSIFHNETSGGERFFDILEQMQKEFGRHRDVVELMYICMALGFEGRYRVLPRGAAALAELRDSTYRMIRHGRGDFERDLSVHWRGVETGYRPLAQRVPLWMIGSVTALLAAVIYLFFNFSLAAGSDDVYAGLRSLPPSGPMLLPHPPVPQPPPAPPPPATVSATAPRLRKFLEPEIKQGLVQVLEDAQTITVRVINRNMFGSGEATLNPTYLPILDRIGTALQDEKGQVQVTGHTDNQPIRTVRFPSNWQLSQARADVVAKIIQGKLSDPGRVQAEGKADNEPIAPNTTPEGRQQNRRNDIILVKPAYAS